MSIVGETTSVAQKLQAYTAYYEQQLARVVDFWLDRTLDRDHGGYLVPISQRGVVIGTDKNMWCHARQIWTFSALCNHLGKRAEWLGAAKLGRDFVTRYAYRGGGRWSYLLDRRGALLNDSRSLVTDNNMAMALAEYATASGSTDDVSLIRDTMDQYVGRLAPPIVDEWYHQSLSSRYIWNTVHMVTLGGLPSLRPFIDSAIAESLATECIEKSLYVFAKDSHRALFEVLSPEGQIVSNETGMRLNPGHALESAWFCMEEGLRRGDQQVIDRAAEVCRWSFELGWDEEFGGIFAYTKPGGSRPAGPEAHAPWGERWDDKVWWVHAESLYAMALAAAATDDARLFDAFEHLHQYIDTYFVDHEYGEWYQYLTRQGEVCSSLKGSWIKCLFHVPRALLKMVLLCRHAGAGKPIRQLLQGESSVALSDDQKKVD